MEKLCHSPGEADRLPQSGPLRDRSSGKNNSVFFVLIFQLTEMKSFLYGYFIIGLTAAPVYNFESNTYVGGN